MAQNYFQATVPTPVCIATMSTKSLRTFAMIYATEELQNPFPLKAMLCEGDMNNPVRRSDAFLYN